MLMMIYSYFHLAVLLSLFVTTSTSPTAAPSDSAGELRGLALVDPNTQAVIQALVPDDIIDLSITGRQLSVRLRRQQRRGYIGSVVFDFDGTIAFSTANRKPFVLGQLPLDAIQEDHEKFPAVENLTMLGQHSIVATSYLGTGGSGQKLATLALNFTVIDSSSSSSSSPSPSTLAPSRRPAAPAAAPASLSPIPSPTLRPTLRPTTTEPARSLTPRPTPPSTHRPTRGPTRRPTRSPTNQPIAITPPSKQPAASDKPLPPPTPPPGPPPPVRLPSGGTEPTDVPAYNASPSGAWTGEMRTWHKLTLGFHGPDTNEVAIPNPFTDYRLDVSFQHDVKGGGASNMSYVVPGYYATDGNAANTHASSGKVWLVHFAPPLDGVWTWTASFTKGTNVAQYGGGSGAGFFDQATGFITVLKTNKSGRDHRGKGMLEYVGEHHLRFAETGEWFLKAGVDSPENLLAYEEFDDTPDNDKGWRKSWSSHVQDFHDGDPTWSGGRGKGIIGAIDYLADMGLNVFSFLTMNINGDDKNVFPYVSSEKEDRMRIDVSKTAQWEVLMEHADKLGLFMHFKLQEYENDQLLDGGALGVERRLYFRELIARFGHHLALNWNMGEENTNTHEERMAFGEFFRNTDPYQHPVVIHSVPDGKNEVYGPLLQESNSYYVGASLQIDDPTTVFDETLFWLKESEANNQKWIVSNDEQGPWKDGVLSDEDDPDHDGIRSNVLWGNIMAGGSGVEFYFGFQKKESDLTCENFRTRAVMFDQTRHALQFFHSNKVPFWDMANENQRLGGSSRGASSNWCLAQKKNANVLVVYLILGGTDTINLDHDYISKWYNPKTGGAMMDGQRLAQGNNRSLGNPPDAGAGQATGQDWVVLLERQTSLPVAD